MAVAGRSSRLLRRVLQPAAAPPAPPLARAYSVPSPSASSSAASSSSSSYPSRPLPSGTRLYNPPPSTTLAHLTRLLEPLGCVLEDDVALRVATHKSSDLARTEGHGEKMAFLGRRVLRLHLSLYLTSALLHSPDAAAAHLSQASIDRLLETKELGATVGHKLGLETAMRWREVRGPTGEPTGLFKSRGSVLEAVIGAIYMKHGIEASSKFFETSVLPNMSLPRSLQAALGEEEQVESEAPRAEAGLQRATA